VRINSPASTLSAITTSSHRRGGLVRLDMIGLLDADREEGARRPRVSV